LFGYGHLGPPHPERCGYADKTPFGAKDRWLRNDTSKENDPLATIERPDRRDAADLDALQQIQEIKEETRLDVIASIRDNVRNLPPERRPEIFADFEGAVKTGDIEYLADTITNWATGGNGYEYIGEPVNRTTKSLFGKYKNDPDMAAVWESIERASAGVG
jgi:hypothetical protein